MNFLKKLFFLLLNTRFWTFLLASSALISLLGGVGIEGVFGESLFWPLLFYIPAMIWTFVKALDIKDAKEFVIDIGGDFIMGVACGMMLAYLHDYGVYGYALNLLIINLCATALDFFLTAYGAGKILNERSVIR